MDLVVDGVGHAFGALPVLDGINLTVAAGEVVVVIGPSGCGKSTLLGILGGLIAPSQGRVATVGAAPAGTLNPVTFVFQDFALLPWRTVAGNVALPLEHHRLPAAERRERVARGLARIGLADFSDAYPRQLSGGMRQRVGIARALAVSPAVLLMDEPLSALDAQTRTLLLEDFIRLWATDQVTAVYVTHNLDEAVRLADRVVVLSRRPGRIRAVLPIAVPRPARGEAAHAPALAALQDELWSLIRDEAAVAEREIADA